MENIFISLGKAAKQRGYDFNEIKKKLMALQLNSFLCLKIEIVLGLNRKFRQKSQNSTQIYSLRVV